jgi:brefeldin A-inhibited guanine nucleotide-exchange protein
MKDDLMAGDSSKEAEAAQRGNLLMNALLTIVGQQKQQVGGASVGQATCAVAVHVTICPVYSRRLFQLTHHPTHPGHTRSLTQVSAEPSDEAIKRTLDHLHEVAKGATYFTATEPDTVRPMMELIWAPLLGCFSLLFDEYHDPRLLAICLSGFAAATCLAAQLGVAQLRDVYVNSLCNFTHLHSPATMKYKNGLAFKYLLKVAQQVGNQLGERWLEVLRCISRWELLQQIASGMPTDAVLFAGQQDKGLGRAAAALKDQLRQLRVHMAPVPGTGGIAGTGQQSMESLAMSEVSIKKAHIGASGKEEEHVIPQEIINSVDTGGAGAAGWGGAGCKVG